VRSTSGAYRVRVLSSPRLLVRVAVRDLQPAVGAALAAGTRAAAFPAWLASTERTTLDAATCLRDELPASGEVDLARTAPFLRLDAF
jgi:hypothetical protein